MKKIIKRIRQTLNLYTEKEMVSFGNYLLKKVKGYNRVSHADWMNWLEENK